MTEEHPNAALTRRVFASFGKDAMAISAALSRDIVWRVPGNTIMSGEYRGRRAVVEFLRRTGLETDGTYRSSLHTVFADDEEDAVRLDEHRRLARRPDVGLAVVAPAHLRLLRVDERRHLRRVERLRPRSAQTRSPAVRR